MRLELEQHGKIMIIFGTRGINRTIGDGNFNCPRCASNQPYTHKAVKRFFTIYFIPLIPMGTAGEFIECNSCAGTFDREIVNYDPVLERKKSIESIRRMSVAYLLDANRCKSAELAALSDIVGDLAGEDIESETIANDVRQAQEAGVELLGFVKREAADFSDDGKWLLMATFRRIVERVNPMLTQFERDRFFEIGKAIGLRKKHVEEFLDTPLES